MHINTDFTVTGWMLCVIPHICKYEKDYSDSDHSKLVKNFIRTLFHGVPEYEMAVTLDIFCTEYIEFDNKNSSFDGDEFIWKSEDIRDGNCHLRNKNIHFLAPRFLVFCMYSHIKGSWYWCSSWGDVKTIKSGKRYAISSDVSEK